MKLPERLEYLIKVLGKSENISPIFLDNRILKVDESLLNQKKINKGGVV